jgi:predicted nucleic acid-binding protein
MIIILKTSPLIVFAKIQVAIQHKIIGNYQILSESGFSELKDFQNEFCVTIRYLVG